MNFKRARYQHGSLTIEKRKGGSVWVYRWREVGAGGKTTRRKTIVGSRSELPSKAAAQRAVAGLALDINASSGAVRESLTINELIEHYKQAELGDASSKTMRTKQVYEHQLDDVIAPKWGMLQPKDVRPIAVEGWLSAMKLSPGSKTKTRGVMSVLFQHAIRYGWATTNPIKLVRQSGLPVEEQAALMPIEVAAILDELRDPFRTLILLAAITGLRRGELFGLKWEDIDFSASEIRVVRSLVDQVEGPPKTLASRRAIPLCRDLASCLQEWRKKTSFPAPGDWVFASPLAVGARPYWPDAVLKRHVRPAAVRAGVDQKIGWHSFRRTLATVLQSSGASVKTTQDLLRHASPVMTLGTYAKSVTADNRRAQDTVAALFLVKRDAKLAA